MLSFFVLQFSSVVRRGTKDFFKGELVEEKDAHLFKPPPSSKTIFFNSFRCNVTFGSPLGPIVLPQIDRIEDFDWTNLLENKNARDYQVSICKNFLLLPNEND